MKMKYRPSKNIEREGVEVGYRSMGTHARAQGLAYVVRRARATQHEPWPVRGLPTHIIADTGRLSMTMLVDANSRAILGGYVTREEPKLTLREFWQVLSAEISKPYRREKGDAQ